MNQHYPLPQTTEQPKVQESNSLSTTSSEPTSIFIQKTSKSLFTKPSNKSTRVLRKLALQKGPKKVSLYPLKPNKTIGPHLARLLLCRFSTCPTMSLKPKKSQRPGQYINTLFLDEKLTQSATNI